MAKLERRYVTTEIEVRSKNGKTVIEGYALKYQKLSRNLGGFVEQVLPGACDVTLRESDIRALRDHNPLYLLGRNRSGTLRLASDTTGVYYEIDPPDTTYAKDLIAIMERGDLNESSFAFFTHDEDWGETDQGYPRRDLLAIEMVDVSPVTFPAYYDTSSTVGSREAALEALAKRSGYQVVDLGDTAAIKAAIRGEPLTRAGVKNSTKHQALETALREKHGADKTWVWVRDFDDDLVWFVIDSEEKYATYQQEYSIDSEGEVTLNGDAIEVEVEVEYTPVKRNANPPENEEAAAREARKAKYAAELERLIKIGETD